MAKALIVASPAAADESPGFFTGARRAQLKEEIAGRLWTFALPGSGVIHVIRLRTASGAPLSIRPGLVSIGVWSFACSGIRAPRARKILKAVKNAASEVLSLQQLRGDARPVAAVVRASPDLRRATAWDVDGVPTAWTTHLVHTIFGYDHGDAADKTSAIEIDRAVAEPLEAPTKARQL